MTTPLRLAFVTGTTPDKWARAWRERRPNPMELVPITEAQQEEALSDAAVDLALVRLPVDREGRHCVRLYDEIPVVVAAVDHFIAAADEVTPDDLTGEQLVRPHASGWRPQAEQLDWPEMDERAAIETVAAGTGFVIVPMSVARQFHRKDVVVRPILDLEPTTVALMWRIERDANDVQDFVGITRGRRANTSR